MVFDDAAQFAETLRSIAKTQSGKSQKIIAGLPVLPDLRMALGVAAADLRPLVVVYAPTSKQLATQTKRLKKIAWTADFVGRMRYVVIKDKAGLKGFEDLKLKSGVSVIQAEAYGRGGKILSQVTLPKSSKALAKTLKQGLAAFDAKAKNVRDHIAKGEREDIKWASAIPVSDPQANPKRGQ
ncbi:MAG: hypothetical protein ACI9X4_002613 [Glaciecola sp.]|jgi:hypothetical protein